MAVSPPRPKDLPLTALRAFEAAARLGGFSAAAQELGVTPGAVTAQIKALEAKIGIPLFERTARGVRLTAAGQRSCLALTAAFDRLQAAMADLRSTGPSVVHVAALPSLAQFWLSPRLPELRADLPGLSVSVTALERPPDAKRHPYDLYLFYGKEPTEVLAPDVIFPVCSPKLRSRLKEPADLINVPVVSDSTWTGDWSAWAEIAMPGVSFVPRGTVYSLYALAVDEAVQGAGVLMGHSALVDRHLARGDLVEPFALRVALPQALRLWPARRGRRSDPARRVARWLFASV